MCNNKKNVKIYKGRPSIAIRERLRELCNLTKHPFYDPTSYEKVFSEFANELKIIPPLPAKSNRCNCFAYALGLDERVMPHAFDQVIKKDLVPTVTPKKGDIVVYYSNGYVPHAGRYESDSKVISKWGDGAVFLHDTFMCPDNYGNNVKFFRKVSKGVAEKFICKYSSSN